MSFTAKDIYTGPWIYDEYNRSVPASVRLRNIGAIGSSRDKHEFRFGGSEGQELPGSDGNPLPTPVFDSVYGGCAYWGHYVVRRAEVKPGVVTIASILKAYSTGHSDTYGNTVSRETAVGLHEGIDLWQDPEGFTKAYKVMVSMGRWEAGARNSSQKGYEPFHLVYNLSDQNVVDEMFYGMVHGMRESWRDQGCTIEKTKEELGFSGNTEAPVEVVEAEEDDRDPLLHGGLKGLRTIITGGLGIVATFFATVFDLLGFEKAQQMGSVVAQVFIGLAVLFLVVKFWGRFEKLLKKGLKK